MHKYLYSGKWEFFFIILTQSCDFSHIETRIPLYQYSSLKEKFERIVRLMYNAEEKNNMLSLIYTVDPFTNSSRF